MSGKRTALDNLLNQNEKSAIQMNGFGVLSFPLFRLIHVASSQSLRIVPGLSGGTLDGGHLNALHRVQQGGG